MAHATTNSRTPGHRRIGGLLLPRNRQGEVLLVNPSYQEGWQLVGGGAVEGEPAVLAARREGAEETSLTDLIPGDLLIVDWIAPNEKTGSVEGYNFVFDGGVLNDSIRIVLPPAPSEGEEPELLDWGFFPPDRVPEVCRDYQAARIAAALAALTDPTKRGFRIRGETV